MKVKINEYVKYGKYEGMAGEGHRNRRFYSAPRNDSGCARVSNGQLRVCTGICARRNGAAAGALSRRENCFS
jgi:hypothetical protein